MNINSRAIPWFLAAVLAIIVGLMWFAMERKDAALADSREKYNQLISEANQKLSDANKRYNELATDANQKLRTASQPEVEVQVSFRKALINSGNVSMLKNISGRSIAIAVEAKRPSTGKSKKFDLTLDASQMKEIGEIEGWAFISGDTLRISQPEHKELVFKAP